MFFSLLWSCLSHMAKQNGLGLIFFSSSSGFANHCAINWIALDVIWLCCEDYSHGSCHHHFFEWLEQHLNCSSSFLPHPFPFCRQCSSIQDHAFVSCPSVTLHNPLGKSSCSQQGSRGLALSFSCLPFRHNFAQLFLSLYASAPLASQDSVPLLFPIWVTSYLPCFI